MRSHFTYVPPVTLPAETGTNTDSPHLHIIKISADGQLTQYGPGQHGGV